MEMNSCKVDALGNEIGRDYSLILTDPYFEKRLKRFDPHLKLTFDQNKKRWMILEYVPAYGNFNILMTAEDEVTKKPIALGDWVFNKLFVWRHNALEKQKNFSAWWDKIRYEEEQQRMAIDMAWSREHQGILADERISWRKAFRELNNLPISDVTAGYPKSQNPIFFKSEPVVDEGLKDDEFYQFQPDEKKPEIIIQGE